MAPQTAIFTIVSANYIAFAATLMQSVRRFHPDMARFIILSDALHSFDTVDLAAELVACDELGIALIGNMKLWYSVIEFNTAVKPFTFQYLFAERGFGSAIYLDPDIALYAPLDEVTAALTDHSLVLTPHMMKPLQDGRHPSDLSIMKSGVYNLGFAAVKNDEDGRNLLQWWSDRLFAHCRVDIAANIFTDQRWMDLSPVFVERPFILRHPGYNVAYWNLLHRGITRDEQGRWLCNGRDLAFFHFSGIKPEDPSVFSKHQDRFTVETLGIVRMLCNEYRERVIANGWLAHNKIPYAYAKFEDGRPIFDVTRKWLLEAVDDGRLPLKRPLRLNSTFFDLPHHRIFAGGGRLTRFAYQFWRERLDLREAFNLDNQDGFSGYVAWLCNGPATDEGAPASLTDGARALRDRSNRALTTEVDRPVEPPWPSMAQDAWTGAARDVETWLSGETLVSYRGVDVAVQRQAALLWEQRRDLQQFFGLHDPPSLEAYHAWSLTDGVREGSILPDLFSADYLSWLETPSSLSSYYGDAPITRGMALTRHCGHAREGLTAWRDFPLDAKARLEQAFWYAFLAPHTFGWPAVMTASIRAYFDAPSDIILGDFALSRGMVAVHSIRQDVQQHHALDSDVGRWRYVCWLVGRGAKEFDIDVFALCPGIDTFLATPSPNYPALSRLAEFVYDQREDVRAAFDIGTPDGLHGMLSWVETDMAPWLDSVGLSQLLPVEAILEPGHEPAAHTCLVALSGDWTIPSGIGEDLRTAVAALEAAGFSDYVIVDLPSRSVRTPDMAVLPAGTAVQVRLNVLFHNAETAAEDWRTIRRIGVTADKVAAHWLWELERLPTRWIHAFSFCDEVWASSQFVKSIFEAEERRPVRLLHHAILPPASSDLVSRGKLGLKDGETVFLFMFDFASYAMRKNPAAVIRAFQAAFPDGSERACLVLKTQNADQRPDLWLELTGMTDDPRIVFKDARLPRNEVTSLVACANAFVSLHRSEGFGRGPAEAMLLGVPVIVTGYSGTNDYTDASCAFIVDYTLVPVRPGEYPGVEGQFWAQADVPGAARHMRFIHDQPKAARALGKRGQKRIRKQLSPARIGATMVELIDALASKDGDSSSRELEMNPAA